MAVITETVVTSVDTDYTIPVYRKNGDDSVHFKIISATRAIMVIVAEEGSYIADGSWPRPPYMTINSLVASDQATYEAARDAAIAYLEAL